MLVLAVILLSVVVVGSVLSPLIRRTAAPLTDGSDLIAELRETYSLRDVQYEVIRDIELDFHAGKIGEPDYRELSQRHKQEAMKLVQQIEALESRLPAHDSAR